MRTCQSGLTNGKLQVCLATDKNEDGLIQYTADTTTNELTNADIMVLANPEIAQLPNCNSSIGRGTGSSTVHCSRTNTCHLFSSIT